MSDLDDIEIDRTRRLADSLGGEPTAPLPPPGPSRPPFLLIGAGAAVLAALIGATCLLVRKKPPEASRPAASPQATAPSGEAATPEPSPLVLPALDQSDAVVRQILSSLSQHPLFVNALTANGLVRLLAAAVDNVSEGGSPRAHLAFLAPEGRFGVIERRGRFVIDPRSYARYDGVGAAAASLDAAACARAYRQLEPLFDAAYRELGATDGSFSKALARAIAHLLATPLPAGDVGVRPVQKAALVYELVDRKLETLSSAQKHLLRMGTQNGGKIQAKLREFAAAAGLDLGAGER